MKEETSPASYLKKDQIHQDQMTSQDLGYHQKIRDKARIHLIKEILLNFLVGHRKFSVTDS